VTGITMFGPELARKRMEIFKETAAGAQRIAVLRNAQNPLHDFLWDDIHPIGPLLGLEFRLFTITDFNDLPTVFSNIKRDGSNALTLYLRCAVLLGPPADRGTRCNAPTSGNLRVAGLCRGRRAMGRMFPI
jgi:hypothetical protein